MLDFRLDFLESRTSMNDFMSQSSTSSAMIPPSVRSQIESTLDTFLRCTTQPKPLHLVYSSRPSWPFASNGKSRSTSSDSESTTDIAVLDSSFNPPHLAHLSLAGSPPFLASSSSSSSSKHYPAHLFLLSSRNADKASSTSSTPTSASPQQRLQGMYLLARELENRLREQGAEPNVAVGLIEEPLMKDKSTLVHQWIKHSHSDPSASSPADKTTRLHWVVGHDTLTRFFALKYYGDSEETSKKNFSKVCDTFFRQEDTTFVCARRPISSGEEGLSAEEKEEKVKQSQEEEVTFLESELVKPWVEKGNVILFDLPEEIHIVNSTAIRKIVGDRSSTDEGDKKQKLRPFVPDSVAQWMLQEGLYRPEE